MNLSHWKRHRISRLESYLCWRRLQKEEAKYLRYLLRLLAESKEWMLKAPRRRTIIAISGFRQTIAVINFRGPILRFSPLIFSHFLAFSRKKYDHWIGEHLSWSYFLASNVNVNTRKENISEQLAPAFDFETNMESLDNYQVHFYISLIC